MPTYVLMTKLAPDAIDDADGRRNRGRAWLERVKESCPEVTWISHYALLGRYDFMDLYEAPDDVTAHKVSLISREEGAVSAESWPALSYDKHLKLMEEVARGNRRATAAGQPTT
jgi:uncharacterized protein with GYD domain